MLSVGMVLYIASKLVRWIPMMGQYKLPAELVGVVLLVVGAYFYGGHGVQSAWLARVAELEAKVKVAEEKSQQINTVIETKIVEKKSHTYLQLFVRETFSQFFRNPF